MQSPSNPPVTPQRPWLNLSEYALPAAVQAVNPPKLWQVFAAAAFLVSVPVFFQASLVRQQPLLSLLLTGVWVVLAWRLRQRPKTEVWGDLLLGFSGSWLAGSIYWGWFRWEPAVHIPIEAICLPLALWGCRRRGYTVGSLFYLGSLLGTAIGDLYFYVANLIPYWRQVVVVEPSLAPVILKSALAQVQTPWGMSWAIALGGVLLVVGIRGLQKQQADWWAFSGAVLSTIVVEGLFALAAALAL